MGRHKQTISKTSNTKYFDEFKKIKIKGHINYQLCAKVDKLFEKLLDNKEINLYNRKRVMDICRDWYNINQSKANLESFL